MLRIILAIIIGFIVWTVLWIGSDVIISLLSPNWYAKGLVEFQNAVDHKLPYTVETTVLIMSLVRSIIFSIIAGFAAASIARENKKSPLGLGVLLLVFGIFVQLVYWHYVPLWYNFLFLFMLVPMTIFGGRLKKI